MSDIHKHIGVPEYFGTPNRLLVELQNLATRDTADYFYNLKSPPEYIPGAVPETMDTLDDAKARLRKEILDEVSVDGIVAEFGVNQGKSFKQLCNLFSHDEKTVYGFDAFDGLPENGKWVGNTINKHQFRNNGDPPFDIPKNGVIINGWFDKTLPEFELRDQPAALLHIDCDVYSSTVTVLNNFVNSIVEGTVIVFDDYCNYPGWRQGEWLAWQEFVNKHMIKYRYIYVAGMAAGIKVEKTRPRWVD